MVGVGEAEGDPDALWDPKESGGGTGADSGCGIAYGETGIVAGAGTGAGGVTAANADGQFGWRTGLGAVTGGAGAEAGRWRGSAGVAGGAERWREGAGAGAAAGEDG